MHAPSTRSLTQARADWLAGDATAWTRYTACIRQLDELRRDDDRTPQARRPERPRARA